ncbi:MAG: hypothetical protein JWP01_1576 [Myxococcales bacterium]|nr:hypothetical protein [Myxococcales bacterium]
MDRDATICRMRRYSTAAAIVATLTCVLASVAGCSRASDEGEAKQWPKAPPPAKVTPPPALAIKVRVNGSEQQAITAATLSAAKPDFQDADRTAWLIPTLIPAAAQQGTTVEAVSPAGVSVKFERPSAAGVEPVLFLTRRGEVIVSALDPKDPFPRYHGQGGRLHRAGDSWPRVAPVERLDITRPTP